jgi:hypothetical protein
LFVGYFTIVALSRFNIFNREAELTKPLIRLFQNSPDVLKELKPALTKCLDVKRKLKSTSLEAVLYTVIRNLIPKYEIINGSIIISNKSIQDELARITNGINYVEKEAINCRDLGIEVTYYKISKTLLDKFNAKADWIGTGDEKQRGALRYTS